MKIIILTIALFAAIIAYSIFLDYITPDDKREQIRKEYEAYKKRQKK